MSIHDQTDDACLSSYAVLPNGRQLHTPDATEKLDEYLCKPLDVPLPCFRMCKQRLRFSEEELHDEDEMNGEDEPITDNDSSETQCPRPQEYPEPHQSEIIQDPEIPTVRKVFKTHRPNIWQLSPAGIIPGMRIPVFYGIEGHPEENPQPEEAEYDFTDLGYVELRFPVPGTGVST